MTDISPCANPAPPGHDLRADAARVAALVADRLSSPRRVANLRAAADCVTTRPPRRWSPLLLAEGHPGVALLFAHLGTYFNGMRRRAHAHLQAATSTSDSARAVGLFGGVAALGFAARATSAADYPKVITQANEQILMATHTVLDDERARLDAGEPGARPSCYGLTGGLTGIGRYLLAGVTTSDDAIYATLTDILRYLVRVTRPIPVDGRPAPGWWTAGLLDAGNRDGRLHLGMAHGIAGPLALLSLARLSGILVVGQDNAIDHIAHWLLSWRRDDDIGSYWPSSVTLIEEIGRPELPYRSRAASWCNGTPGIARALQLAGRARGRPDWERAAVMGMRDVFRRPPIHWRTEDVAICHGSAGLLHATRRVQRDSGDAELRARIPGLVRGIIKRFDPDAPFGFRYRPTPGNHTTYDLAGFLDGAAGTAVALADFAYDPTPRTCPWDAALLMG